MNINLKLKRPKSKKSVIFTEFSKNGSYYRFYTGKTISTNNWSSKGLVKAGEDNYQLINQYLNKWVNELKRIFEEMEVKQERLTKEAIQIQLDKYFKKDEIAIAKENEVNDFISFIESYNYKKRDNKRNLQRLNHTKKLIITAFNLITKKHLEEWEALTIKEKSRCNLSADYKLRFEDINLKFIEKFREYMFKAKFTVIIKGNEITQNYKINYIDKQVKTLKQFINYAIEEGYVQRFTWRGIKSEMKEVDSVYTDFNEIQQLYDEPLSKKTEILVRDKYVLNCFLGMRYSDLNRLEPHLFSKRKIAGKDFLEYLFGYGM